MAFMIRPGLSSTTIADRPVVGLAADDPLLVTRAAVLAQTSATPGTAVAPATGSKVIIAGTVFGGA